MSLLKLTSISKSFGSVQALKSVSLDLRAGEVLALVGENGAGKSTLMKVLSGIYPAGDYLGQIQIDGQVVSFEQPADAEASGVAIIHQELSSFLDLTVAENMFVGHWPKTTGLFGGIDFSQMLTRANQQLASLGADFSAEQKMSELSAGEQQVVEIAKALLKSSRILILDEPTSSLTPKETAKLLELIDKLKAGGRGIIYISHRLEEIFALADRVVVLRDGESVLSIDRAKLNEADLIKAMVGRELNQLFPPRPANELKENILELKNFIALNRRSKRRYGPLNLTLKRGEILGFSGLLGSGRSEFLRALLGDEDYQVQGEVYFQGKLIDNHSLSESYGRSFGLINEDRKEMSLLPQRSLIENSGVLRLCQGSLFHLISDDHELKRTQSGLSQMRTRYSSELQKITELSGGNQQKVLFSRMLQALPKLVILDEPTRGVDVGAKYEIYQLLYEWVKQGLSILLVSSDLPELMGLSDRIIVMSNGAMTLDLSRQDFRQETIMEAALKPASEELPRVELKKVEL